MLINNHESRTPGVIFTGMWTYKPSHGALGVLLIGAAVLLLGRTALVFFQDDIIIQSDKIGIAVLLGIVGCVMFYFGSMLFFSLVTGYGCRLVISEEGVRYGTRYYSWRKIHWLDARMRDGCYQVLIARRSGIIRQRWLTTDDGLTQEQRDKLIHSLEQRVVPNFPHLRAGDTAHAVGENQTASTEPVKETADAS